MALQAAPGREVAQRRRRSRSADAKFSIERTYDPAAKTRVATVLTTIDASRRRTRRRSSSTPRSRIRCCPRAWPSTAARSCRRSTSRRWATTPSTPSRSARGRCSFVSWTKDDKVVLEANPDYWGGKIEVDRLIMRPIPETAPRIAALLKGEVDIITQLPPDQGERVAGNASTRVSGALYAGPLRARGEQQGAAARQSAREAGAVARHRSRGHRQGAVARPRHRAERPHREGRQPLRRVSLPGLAYNPKEARERLKKAGYKNEEIVIETTVGYMAQRQADGGGDRGHVEGRRASTPRSRSSSTRCAPRRTATRASRACGGRIRRPRSAIPTA